ncbi:hypothetical protein [Campylobacter pinnipediorum]|uniref:Uncharacterized protein n=1 Tax=Campylobacter pinnipediorum subsp. pinnipediorum TaxID=1660067 RepID=A0AAX0LAS0_9BACT|nr:hypothetical protein [Campylobacter pinnipediorum]AQW80946.1 putative membrane protein [Campylobacter pinnipediorum subsp. pinnipediorum]AQW82561.1 putative membrane protein [Campylobacter pinnipediorum subsp. pinnipediorum]AQW84246.1 putative membrane protein [Campylobacter pinnipediorum subsp. pinnipediorum]OPA78849.1 hypothetical protein BFG04_02135 [Campylobacter pinnipediorum subsp. pinnipediorum]
MKNFKSKLFVLGSVAAVAANSAAAAVSLGSDGAVSGNIDMATFYGVAGVVIVASGIIYSVKTGLRLLRG